MEWLRPLVEGALANPDGVTLLATGDLPHLLVGALLVLLAGLQLRKPSESSSSSRRLK